MYEDKICIFYTNMFSNIWLNSYKCFIVLIICTCSVEN